MLETTNEAYRWFKIKKIRILQHTIKFISLENNNKYMICTIDSSLHNLIMSGRVPTSWTDCVRRHTGLICTTETMFKNGELTMHYSYNNTYRPLLWPDVGQHNVLEGHSAGNRGRPGVSRLHQQLRRSQYVFTIKRCTVKEAYNVLSVTQNFGSL